MEAKWKVNWDYTGWKKYSTQDMTFTQNDWNQTIMTCVNQVSAQMYQATLKGPADTVKINEKILSLFDSLDYCMKQEDGSYKLSTRYKIVFDDSLPLDKVIVTRTGEEMYSDLVTVILDVTTDDVSFGYYKPNSPELAEIKKDSKHRIITPDMFIGEITIFNI